MNVEEEGLKDTYQNQLDPNNLKPLCRALQWSKNWGRRSKNRFKQELMKLKNMIG